MKIEFEKSPNYSKRKKDVKLIVIHWTGGSYNSAKNWLCSPDSSASTHYIIDEYGDKVVQLVREEDKAWTCGKSYLEGYGDNLNHVAISLELVGPPSKIKTKWWMKSQIKKVAEICNDIQTRYPDIKITDHNAISPTRKLDVRGDTGHKKDIFPWDMLMKMTTVPEA